MAGKRRKKSRCGRHLPPVPSSRFIEEGTDFAKINKEREARGFKLNENVRLYLSVKGIVTARFVWRKRDRDTAVSITEVLRFPFEGLGS